MVCPSHCAFALCGRMRNQVGTLEFDKLGGLATHAPFLTVVFSLSVPSLPSASPAWPTSLGEIMVFAGTFDPKLLSPEKLSSLQWTTILALWGVVISAVYMLRAYRKAVFRHCEFRPLSCRDPRFLPAGAFRAAGSSVIDRGLLPKFVPEPDPVCMECRQGGWCVNG
jgi:NADH:ubiquinone oxidoreductase subunit 4 (subunit M)